MDKYIPKTFKNRDILDADDVNRIENALAEVVDDAINDPTVDDIPQIMSIVKQRINNKNAGTDENISTNEATKIDYQ
jgi:hypothetical protein